MDNEANSIKSNSDIANLQDLFTFTPNNTKSSNAHISWRINKMGPARVLRALFPRPYILSEWSGQSIERYLMIDEPNASGYTLPNMECSYVFLIQGSGERSIILKPSKECIGDCRTVSVLLKHPYVCKYITKVACKKGLIPNYFFIIKKRLECVVCAGHLFEYMLVFVV